MRAAWQEKYGGPEVIEIREVPRPEVKADQVLVQVFATSVTTGDWRMRAMATPGIMALPARLMFGVFAPRSKIPGSAFAGRVVSVGGKVTRFRMGDAVFGFAPSGAHAEYVAVAETGAIAAKPEALTYDEAAAVPFGALSALVFLRDFARVKPGQKVLVTGASGGVGVFAVQLAKHFGARVTALASTPNVDLVASLGADRVIDYTKEDFTRSGETYDLVFDTASVTTFVRARQVLAPEGVFLPLDIAGREMLQALRTAFGGGQKVKIGVSGDKAEDLAFIAGLIEEGSLRPVIDSRFPLARIADAHRRVETRHKTGAVVVTVDAKQALRVAA